MVSQIFGGNDQGENLGLLRPLLKNGLLRSFISNISRRNLWIILNFGIEAGIQERQIETSVVCCVRLEMPR